MDNEKDIEIDLKTYLLTNHCKYYNLHGKPNRIFLIGLMGSGKTTLSEKLAKEFNYKVYHSDRLWLEPHYGRIFDKITKIDHPLSREENIEHLANGNWVDKNGDPINIKNWEEYVLNKFFKMENTIIDGLFPIMLSKEYQLKLKNECFVIIDKGKILATLQSFKRDNIKHWFSNIRNNIEFEQQLDDFIKILES